MLTVVARGTCSVEDCEATTIARGWCSKHYQRWQHTGDPLGRKPRAGTPQDHPDGTRTCRDCGQRKPIDDFGRDQEATLGRRATCRPCRSAQSSDWYAANQPRQLARHQQRKAADRDRIRQQDTARYRRHRAKRIGLVVEAGNRRRALLAQVPADPGITPQALRERDGDSCHYCAVVMDFTPGDGRTYSPTKATVEHVLPLTAGGHHTWANVVLACWQCNIRKQARTADEWLEVLGATRT